MPCRGETQATLRTVIVRRRRVATFNWQACVPDRVRRGGNPRGGKSVWTWQPPCHCQMYIGVSFGARCAKLQHGDRASGYTENAGSRASAPTMCVTTGCVGYRVFRLPEAGLCGRQTGLCAATMGVRRTGENTARARAGVFPDRHGLTLGVRAISGRGGAIDFGFVGRRQLPRRGLVSVRGF